MLLSPLHSHSQRAIFVLALGMTLFFNITFFNKLFNYAFAENNYFFAFTSPFVLMLVFIAVLNLLLLFLNKLTFRLLIAFFVFTGVMSSYFIDTFGAILDKNMFTNVFQTDTKEAFGLITPKLIAYFVTASFLSFWIIFKVKINFSSYPKEIAQKTFVFIVSIILIGGFYVSFGKNYASFFRNHNELRMYLNPSYPIGSLSKYIYWHFKPKPKFQSIADDATRTSSQKKKLVVLVVGETARAANFSLGGYKVSTNPLLSKEEHLVYLSNTSSCGTATATSLPCMFSKFGREGWSDSKLYFENIVDVLTKTGVRVIWRDNNSGADKEIAKRLSEVDILKAKNFDISLLENFQKNLDLKHEDTFIVLHQEGSHGPTYFQRYPEEFKRFTPTCDTKELEKCSQEQIVNTYDNTILYTDFVISETIKLLKANEDKYQTTLLYFSDHGESLGENGIYLHGMPYMIAPKTQTHIPALLYFGKGLEAKEAKLRASRDKEYSHDNIFHTLLGIFEIKTDEYKTNLDLLH